MSYVIQNFHNNKPALVVTQRLKLLTLYNNLPVIQFLLTSLHHMWLFNRFTFNCAEYLKVLYKSFHVWGIERWLSDALAPRYAFFDPNLVKSLRYWVALSTTNSLLSGVSAAKVTRPSSRRVLNQALTPVTVLGISFQGKTYRTVLFRFFMHIISNYRMWNKQYVLRTRFLILTPDFYLVKYYNRHFFKAYNF